MKEGGLYVAIAALLITLGGALYGWAQSQGAQQQQIIQLQGDMAAIKAQVNNLSTDTNGMRLEVTRWMAAADAANRRRDAR